MSVFDVEITVLRATIGVPNPDLLAAGMPHAVELGLTTGLTLPFAHPTSGDPIMVPVGQFRFTFNKEQAIQVFGEAVTAAESLPDSKPASTVLTASSMADVERAAQSLKGATGQ